MNTEYVRETGKTYLRVAEEPDMDEMQMKMFIENHTDNFLPITKYRINDCGFYKYDISSMTVMSSVFEDREMHADDISSLTDSVRMAVSEAEKYLADSDGIQLSPDYIYRDGSGKWKFIYFAGSGQEFYDGLRELFEYIIRRVSHKDSAGSAMAYGIYKRLCDGENDIGRLFETEESVDIKAAEVQEERQVIESVMPQTVTEEREVPDKFKLYALYGIAGIWALAVIVFLAGIIIPGVRISGMSAGSCLLAVIALAAAGYVSFKWYLKNKDKLFRIKTERKEIPYEQSTVRILIPQEKEKTDEEYTVVLNAQPQKQCHSLTWDENNCRRSYDINKNVCIIGSAPEKADCVINVAGISRTHARISREEDRYFVKDLNSTNGTTVNGKTLACFEIYEIESGDVLMLGNVKCVFN